MRKIHLAIIRQTYSSFGGAEKFIEVLANSLANKMQIKVTIICRKWEGDLPENISVIRISPFYTGRLTRDIGFMLAVKKHLKQNQYDVVQSHERLAFCDIYRAGDGIHWSWLRRKNKKLLFRLWVDFLSPYHLYQLWQERKIFVGSSVKKIVVNSSFIKQEALKFYPSSEKKLITIRNGVNTNTFQCAKKDLSQRQKVRTEYGIQREDKLLLFLGSGYERKGLNFALRVLTRLPKEFRLMIVGKDKHESKYIGMSKVLGLESRCVFLGPQPSSNKFYCLCDAFIFPTQYDPMPNAVLEAMSSSCVCYVSDASGATDYIKNAENGFIMSLDSPDDWAELIKKSFNNLDDRGQKARQTMVENNNQEMARRFEALYLEVAKS